MVDGLAVTTEPLAEFRLVDGDQLYVLAPLAVRVTPVPPG